MVCFVWLLKRFLAHKAYIYMPYDSITYDFFFTGSSALVAKRHDVHMRRQEKVGVKNNPYLRIGEFTSLDVGTPRVELMVGEYAGCFYWANRKKMSADEAYALHKDMINMDGGDLKPINFTPSILGYRFAREKK